MAAVACALWSAQPAHADLTELKAACQDRTAAPGHEYRHCDDGVPSAGGTAPNPTGARAIKVPARYDGHEGLPGRAADAAAVPGADPGGDVALDVNVSLPKGDPPEGGRPMVVFMHGCCGGHKGDWEVESVEEGRRLDARGERWHYSNAWFASRGYVAVNYTARGFVDGNGNGSTGQTQIDSRLYEVNDLQHLAGQIADDPFFAVDPERIVVTGGSYGGGLTWMAMTDPVWRSPGGEELRLAAVAPKYGWTDLVYSLAPSGRHFNDPGRMPAADGSASVSPVGIPKRSIVAGLYASGKTGVVPGSRHATFPSEIDEAFVCLQSSFPPESNPLCGTTLSRIVPSFVADRSAYYQDQFFARIASEERHRVPLFAAATFTDPLFTAVENLRMVNRLRATVRGYPVQLYFGDYQHFTQNKAKEWGDVCGDDRHVCRFDDYPEGDPDREPAGLARTGVTTLLNRFVDHYAKPAGNPKQAKPRFDVTASLQVCKGVNDAEGRPADEPGETFTAPTFAELTPGLLGVEIGAERTTGNQAEPNFHATRADPVANQVGNGSRCVVETGGAGGGVATYDSEPLPRAATMLGATEIEIDYEATTADGLQLNTRLYDLFPDGRAVLVDRGPRRVTERSGTVTYQLHGNGWRFEKDHRLRVEIAQDDDPYLRSSDVPSSAMISRVALRVPVRETEFGVDRASDRTRPTARLRAPRLASSVSSRPTFRVRWSGRDLGSGISGYQVQVKTSPARRWRSLKRRAGSTSLRFRGRSGRTHRFRLRARDRAGNHSRWRYASTVVPASERARGVRLRGPWRLRTNPRAFSGRYVTCSSRACSISFRYRGGDLYLIGRTASNGGRARLTIDGRDRTADFYGRRARHHRAVARVRLRRGIHRATLRVLARGRKASRGREVGVDGFAVRSGRILPR